MAYNLAWTHDLPLWALLISGSTENLQMVPLYKLHHIGFHGKNQTM